MTDQRAAILENIAGNVCILAEERLIIAIDGVDTSGKTHFADELATVFEVMGKSVIRASIDDFHNPREIRYAQGADSPEGYYQDSFNLDKFVSFLLLPFKNHSPEGILTSIFDVSTDNPVEISRTQAPQEAILVIDGIFLMRPELEEFWDYKIFLDIPFEEVIKRAMLRDKEILGDDIERKYRTRYLPAQKKYLEELNPKSKADTVINNQDLSAPFIVAK